MTYKVYHPQYGEIVLAADSSTHAVFRASEMWGCEFRKVMKDAEVAPIEDGPRKRKMSPTG